MIKTLVPKLLATLVFSLGSALGAEPRITLEETFEEPLSADWHWGLGTWTAQHPVVAEPKAQFGFGGESGGPEGEKAGALEFRKLKIVANP
jgi:hypothetical protein